VSPFEIIQLLIYQQDFAVSSEFWYKSSVISRPTAFNYSQLLPKADGKILRTTVMPGYRLCSFPLAKTCTYTHTIQKRHPCKSGNKVI